MLSILLTALGAIAAYSGAAPTPPPLGLQLFVDFDGTIITSDAFSTLAYAGYDSLPRNASVPSWDEIESNYGQIQSAAADTLPEPTDLKGAIDYANNSWSFVYVNDSGVFENVTRDNLVKYARNVTMREGWCDFAHAALDHGVQINVISLNWSASWIRLVLQEASSCPALVNNMATYSPEILPEGVLPASDLNHPTDLFSGGDKTSLIEEILQHIPEESKERVLFFSDGNADLQPLWEAPTTAGFVAGSDGSAAEAFSKFNVTLWPASEGWQGNTGTAGENNTIYSFEGWTEVTTLIWG